MNSLYGSALRWLGWAAAILHLAAVAGFGAALSGYSQTLHPVALLGAQGFPHALAFNVLAFVLPGLLMAAVALGLRHAMPSRSGWHGRVGCQLLLLSALGFVAMGLLPLDATDLDNSASRYHATAWMLWWVAFVPGALLLAASQWAREGVSRFARLTVALALSLLAIVLIGVELLPPGVAQRLAFGLWLAWGGIAAMRTPAIRAA